MNTFNHPLPTAVIPPRPAQVAGGRKRYQPGIRAWLVLMGGAVLLPLLALCVYLVLQVHTAHETATQRELAERTESAAHAVRERLEAGMGYLNALAVSDAAMNSDLPALYAQAQRVSALYPGATGIGLMNPNLKMVFMTAKPLGAPLPRPPNTTTSERVFATGAPAVSGHFIGPFTGKSVVSLGVPVFRQGEVVHSLFMVISSESITDLLHAQSLPNDWIAAVVDRRGNILARTQSPEKFVGTQATQEVQAFLQAKRQGLLDSKTKEGIPVTAYLAPVMPYQWHVGVSVPKETLMAPLRHNLFVLLCVALVVFAAGLAGASLAGKALENWTVRVLQAVRAIKTGSHCALRPSRVRELDAMAQSLTEINTSTQLIRANLQQTEQQRDQAAQALKHARIDGLTGLRVRSQFYDDVQARQQSLAPGESLALLFVDLDRFKAVNDRDGHEAGDQLLMQVGRLLQELAGEQHIAGRWGGDEFVLCVLAPTPDIEVTAQSLAEQLAERVTSVRHGLGCSVGIAVWDDTCPGLGDLIRRADVSMYRHKLATLPAASPDQQDR